LLLFFKKEDLSFRISPLGLSTLLSYIQHSLQENNVLTIGLAEAQEKLGSLVDLAEAGETICIMRRGKQVAQLTAITATEVVHTLPEVEALPRWTASV
jgi:antitoxin (DNA-binding transcriptional repressor) of toxin-antitoxin stability system